ncbi:MAG: type II toxin-antitoxin system HicA family toxin [Gemmatimonadota bacterium]|nr:type II toxin-antitoxin system HicA family toxin [Acidobacteriota bacterium]MDQ3518034.1 type II toxin-antitoxin system HicA family toxin [Gemmatimonadota bacterium]
MKRVDLVRHIERHGCALFREGSRHSVYLNRSTRKSSTVPRHREINEFVARKICRDLEIPLP